MLKTSNYNTAILVLILLSMAVSPAFALGADGRNLLLIVVMSVSPLIILRYGKFYANDIALVLFILSIVIFPIIVHPEDLRWSTVLYTGMFCLTFMAYKQLLYHKSLTIDNYLKLLKYLIYAYFIVLLIQQFCVLTGLPIFNVSNYHATDPWKLNSLTSEPSHSARIVAVLMYSYITIKEIATRQEYNFRINFKEDKWIWFGFLWTMITMGSGTAFLFFVIVLLKFVRFKKMTAILVISGIVILVTSFLEITSFERTYRTFIATLSFNPEALYEADHSAAFRIVPIIILAQMVGITSLNDWLGHGVDYVGSFLSDLVIGLPEGYTGGGLFQLWMDFGFISFMLFLLFNFANVIKKGDYLSWIFWFMLVFIQGINNQIVWLCIILLFTNKYFQQKDNNLTSPMGNNIIERTI